MPYKVLVVDDEAPVRDLFYDLLKKEKCEVTCVADGQSALDAVTKDDYEVMLLDIKLPDISGLEVLKRAKDLKPGLIVIMITGFGYDEELISKSKEYGCAGYIGKNVPISQIMSSFKLFVESGKKRLEK